MGRTKGCLGRDVFVLHKTQDEGELSMTGDRQTPGDQAKLPSETKPDDRAQSNVEQLSSMMAAQEALAESEISTKHALYARRCASEAAARTLAGEAAVDLDTFVREKELSGFRGGNYPTYDITSHAEVASVKTHWDGKGELDRNAIRAYKRDFAKMWGWGRSSGALEKDAENILLIRGAEGPVPPILEQASETEAAEYLRDNARLRIPDDHVDTMRSEIEADIYAFPGNYHLSDSPSPEQVKHILERIQGIGITSNDLRKLIDARMAINDQRKAQ